jgi:hypothetical protein
MTQSRFQVAFFVATAVFVAVPRAAAQADNEREMTLIHRDGRAANVHVVEISGSAIVHLGEETGWVTHKTSDCIALVDAADTTTQIHGGLLELTDGQRLPGSVVSEAASQSGHFAWDHAWLGRVEVPLEQIARVIQQPGAMLPAESKADVIVLRNGDVVEGLVTALGNPVIMEVEQGGEFSEVELPLDRVAAVRIVAPARSGAGWRVWFRDGTVLDVTSLRVGDDRYVRLRPSLTVAAQPENLRFDTIAGVLFAPQSMTPLGAMTPTRVSGPSYRYTIPPPQRMDGDAPLRTARVEFRGPMTAHYELPQGATRFVCEAVLPESAWTWGDVELIVRCDDAEVGRFTLNAANPRVSVSAALPGSELILELDEGRNGPIQDQIILRRAMILSSGG